jgi:anaphase-promoting complex subunit 4
MATAFSEPHALTATEAENSIIVTRYNHQVAFVVKHNKDAPITALQWKPDGSVLGAGYSDGTYGLYSGENGKSVSNGDLGSAITVENLSWRKLRVANIAQRPGELENLSKSIALMDTTAVLPRLSALPSHGLRLPSDNRFGTQAATDWLFQTTDPNMDCVDMLVLQSSNGVIHLLMDDTVEVGSFEVDALPSLEASFTEEKPENNDYIDLPLPKTSSHLLLVVAVNTKRIQNLLAYILQTLHCIQHDFSTGLQFPTRLISNISAELEEKDQGDLVTNLYHLAMTGQYTPLMLEWLTDIVKETNHKRWDQAVATMYKHIQDHLFINLKPALDRLTIAITSIRGYARYLEGSGKFDVEPALFTAVLSEVDKLREDYHSMLDKTMVEQKRFRAFSKWMRVMIDVGVAGPGTKNGTETEEKELPNIDYSQVLQYIENMLTPHTRADFQFDSTEMALRGSIEVVLASISQWQIKLLKGAIA